MFAHEDILQSPDDNVKEQRYGSKVVVQAGMTRQPQVLSSSSVSMHLFIAFQAIGAA